MQLILLSGGSGKRLWPLSNDARSKQFLQLLKAPDGTMESMVQRVVRQIREADITRNITIATNSKQRDVIENQLGDSVSVVTEPERRDTFPAIALASEYLKMEKDCPDDEIVVVMPCDPYTEAGYFESIGKMVQAVEQNAAELVLMGIKPTYASPKYGYIVFRHPEQSDELLRARPEKGSHNEREMLRSTQHDVLTVSRFTEKPTIAEAEKLLKQNACWNGGVFAFRLGYMTAIAEKYVTAGCFKELQRKYSEFPKISFDYEVAEKANSVAMVPYNGAWKDLGTWNTLTEELPSNIIGNGILGNKCNNTHIINELGAPIFCDGLKDVVVSAGPDGILVCAKNTSETIKDYVDKLIDRPMYEERRWGTYQVLNSQDFGDGFKALTKTITLKKGKNISYQIHHHRSEVWTFVDGEGIFVLDGKMQRVRRGDVVNIPAEHFHAVKALTNLTFIEVQQGGPLVEDDIERFEFDWSRVKL